MQSSVFILLVSGMIFAASAAPDFGKQVQFFSGLYLLQGAPGLSKAQKSQKFIELETFTGIDSKTAQRLIAHYRTEPAEWRKLCDSVTALVSQAPEVAPVPQMPPPKPVALQQKKRR